MRAVGIGSREAYLFWKLDARDWGLVWELETGGSKLEENRGADVLRRQTALESAVFVSIRILYCGAFVWVTGDFNRGVSIRRAVMSGEWRVMGRLDPGLEKLQ